jgi:hypothetical protein
LCTLAYHHRTEGFRTVAKGIKGANGITAEKPGKRVFVSEIMGGVIFWKDAKVNIEYVGV